MYRPHSRSFSTTVSCQFCACPCQFCACVCVSSVSLLPLMRRARGSTRRYAQSNDLEPRARRSGVPARQAGGVVMRVAQPPQPLNSSNTQHAATTHPRRQLGSAPNSVEISSIGGTMDPQRIRVPRFLDPRQPHKTFISGVKAPTAHAGILASNKQLPRLGLAQASQPCKLRQCPTSRAASPGPGVKYRDWATVADRLAGTPSKLVDR